MKITLLRLVAGLATLSATAHAHFKLLEPSPIHSFDEDLEPNAPCGGFTPNFSADSVTDFHVGGDVVMTLLAHPQATFLYRGTLDETGNSGWTQLFPMIEQTGLGDMCERQIPAPANWAGKKGLIGVVCDSPDGILYQCAAVNFISGIGTAPSSCTNSSITATSVVDPVLANMVGGAADTNTTTPSSTTSATPSASHSGNAAPGLMEPSVAGVGVATIGALLGAGLMI